MHATSRIVDERRADVRPAGHHVDDAGRQVRQRVLDHAAASPAASAPTA